MEWPPLPVLGGLWLPLPWDGVGVAWLPPLPYVGVELPWPPLPYVGVDGVDTPWPPPVPYDGVDLPCPPPVPYDGVDGVDVPCPPPVPYVGVGVLWPEHVNFCCMLSIYTSTYRTVNSDFFLAIFENWYYHIILN